MTMKFFTIFNFKIYWLSKNILWGSSQLVHLVFKELLRLSDGVAYRSFCRSDMSSSLWLQNSLKALLIFFYLFIYLFFYGCCRNSFISKELSLKEPLDDVILHTGNCSDIQMALRTNHFVDRTFRGSNWNPTEQLVKVC